MPLASQTNAFGNAFEHFIILECIRHASYTRKNYRFNYLRTPSDAEIDFIVERPGEPLLCIEIKSSTQVKSQDISTFKQITAVIPNCEAVVFSRDKYAKQIDHVTIHPWQSGLEIYF